MKYLHKLYSLNEGEYKNYDKYQQSQKIIYGHTLYLHTTY